MYRLPEKRQPVKRKEQKKNRDIASTSRRPGLLACDLSGSSIFSFRQCGGGGERKSRAVPKVSGRKPTDLSRPWMAARTSSSMTNTAGAPGGVFMCADFDG